MWVVATCYLTTRKSFSWACRVKERKKGWEGEREREGGGGEGGERREEDGVGESSAV